MATGTGTAVLDFGAAPGTNLVSVNVAGLTGLVATDHIEAFMMGTDSTAEHNTYEHMIAPIKLSVSSITAGSGFTITGFTDNRLTGTFKIHYVWAS